MWFSEFSAEKANIHHDAKPTHLAMDNILAMEAAEDNPALQAAKGNDITKPWEN